MSEEMQVEARQKNPDEVFCASCGSVIKAAAEICPKCGVRRQPVPVAIAVDPTAKSRLGYILLGVFLGYLGIHNFYAGYTGRGIVQLLLTVVSCGLLFFVPMIWAIIEICTVTTDASGKPFVN